MSSSIPQACDIQVSRLEIEECIAPYVVERFKEGDPRWAGIVAKAASHYRKERWRRALLGWIPRFRRTQRGIENGYTDYWARTSIEEQLAPRQTPVPCRWASEGLLAHAQGTKRVQHLLLMRAIEKLKPSNVLEVGAGNGLNLLLLSARFPGTAFTGAELTSGGVETARKMQGLPKLPSYIADFSTEPLPDLQAHKKVQFLQGNACALPFPDRSFDVVFTSLALEQMEEVRHQALREIARVARRHVVMVEPFRDWNADGLRRDYIISQDYFSASIKELPRYGLTPVFVHADIPCKLNIGVGLVIAQAAAGA